MRKLQFSKDEGSAFYKELKEKLDEYFTHNNIARTGNRKMIIKIVLYFGLDILFYYLMITSTSLFAF
jgi:linoleoyl-CoA desaturase